MLLPRDVTLEPEAAMALGEILGIMTGQLFEGSMQERWDAETVVGLQMRQPTRPRAARRSTSARGGSTTASETAGRRFDPCRGRQFSGSALSMATVAGSPHG